MSPTRLPELSESMWQTHVVELGRMYGWLDYHTFDSRHSQPGWPDLVLAHPRRRRVVFLELKTNTGKVTPSQLVWLFALKHGGLEVSVIRPCDLPFVKDALGPKNLPLPDCPELAA